MKTLSTEQQQELQELLSSLAITMDVTPENLHLIRYWGIELKPKRVRKLRSSEDGALAPKKQNILDTEEGVIEQAYRDHTGGL